MIQRLGRRGKVEIGCICIKQHICELVNNNMSCAGHPTRPFLQKVALRIAWKIDLRANISCTGAADF